jgi:hypothetical protein
MRPRLHRADVVAFAILAVLVSVIGTGIGVAAAHVRDGGSSSHAPIHAILSGSNDVPSLQRDRAHFREQSAPR